jgi:hypothetical protein
MRALRVLGWIGIATLGVIVLGVGILLGISRGWQRERLTPVLEQLLSEALGAEVRVGALEGPLYPWLILQRVELSGDVGRVRLGQLRIELDHLDLTERHLALRDVGVTDLEADLRRLPPAAAPAAGAPAAEPPLCRCRSASPICASIPPGSSSRMRAASDPCDLPGGCSWSWRTSRSIEASLSSRCSAS